VSDQKSGDLTDILIRRGDSQTRLAFSQSHTELRV